MKAMKTEQEARNILLDDWNKNSSGIGIYVASAFTLSEAFIEEFADRLNWEYVSKRQILSEPFMEKWAHKIGWYWVSSYQILSEPFIEKWADKLVWDFICSSQTLSEPFIEKWAHKVDWAVISTHQKLSEDFIIKHKDKIKFEYLTYNKQVNISYKIHLASPNEISLKRVKFKPEEIEALIKKKKISLKKILASVNSSTLNGITRTVLKI